MSEHPTIAPAATRADKLVVAVAMLFPSVVTWFYFIWLAESKSQGQQLAFAVGKAAQFAMPVVWVALTQPGRLGWRRSPPIIPRRYVLLGIAFGLTVSAAMMAMYFVVLKPQGWFDEATPQILDKVSGFGVASPMGYLALAMFYALIHSGLEEYYWRWFVFGQLGRFQSVALAAVVSSLGFMAHHVILLGYYFGWASTWAYLFSLCVAVGGLIWAGLYHRSQSIGPSWISHLIVDAGIFLVGYDVVRRLWL
jgi:membrane protease YdiL (CAAX protease family)